MRDKQPATPGCTFRRVGGVGSLSNDWEYVTSDGAIIGTATARFYKRVGYRAIYHYDITWQDSAGNTHEQTNVRSLRRARKIIEQNAEDVNDR